MYRKILAISFAVAAFALPSLAQTPNLSGTWKLNLSKSDFGQIPPPSSETLTITDSEPSVKIVTDQKGGMAGDTNTTSTLSTDGKETTSPGMAGADVKNITHWEGKSLVTNSKTSFQGSDLSLKTTDMLSDDGKTLNVTVHIEASMGVFEEKLVYDKQDGSAAMMATPGAAAMIHAGGGDPPNLGGTWKLNLVKSDYGQIPGPVSQIDTIEDNEPSIKITEDQKGGFMGDSKLTTSLSTDGKETTSPGMGNSEVKSTSHWEGGALVVNAKSEIQGSAVAIKDTFTVSADGKTLTEVTHIESGMGNFDLTTVFDKQ
jgi:hypothetical protein